jgi:glycerol kinase
MVSYILSIDQGTTSCRAIVFTPEGEIVGLAQKEFSQYFPQAGWVEHDANEILETQIGCIKAAVEDADIESSQIACVGLTNQRETTVVWDRTTGKPICNAIVWQCRRTAKMVEQLVERQTKAGIGLKDLIREKTGLIPDAYFSGPKIGWILDNIAGARSLAEAGKLAFGTIDSWLIYKLTEEGKHLTEASNASRTMLFDIGSLSWNSELLNAMRIPDSMLPEVVDSDNNFGMTKKDILGFRAPLLAVLGDQQAALFGQACFGPGQFKCTYGTGSFLLGNIGNKRTLVNGLLTTVAWKLKDEAAVYAIEGASFMGGAAIQWLRDKLDVIQKSDQSEELARSLDSNGGVYIVPAHVGLGSPWWNPHARGTIVGLSRDSGKAHLARAALESIAYQIKDITQEIITAGINISKLRVDGGASENNWLMQFQADLLGIHVKRFEQIEATAWGAAALAGLGADLIKMDKLTQRSRKAMDFYPQLNREAEYTLWRKAVETTLYFAK